MIVYTKAKAPFNKGLLLSERLDDRFKVGEINLFKIRGEGICQIFYAHMSYVYAR
jgi:hypothetical protein